MMRIISKKKYFISFLCVILLSSLLFILYKNKTNNNFSILTRDSKNTSQYNVILISIDTLRPDHMSLYGYKNNTTPFIDKWSENAFVFENVFTSSPITYPSFVSAMTGMHPLRSRIVNNTESSSLEDSDNPMEIMNKNEMTLAKILKQNGYTTGAFMTNYVLRPETTNMNTGFDVYSSMWEWYAPRIAYLASFEKAMNWLDENQNKSFFLWVHLMDPHTPYKPSEKYSCLFNKAYCGEISSKTIEELDKERETLQGCGEALSKQKIDLFKTLYDGEIGVADELAGQVLNAIKYKNLEKNTIIILYGDHGEGFDHNYYFVHGDMLYHSAIKIPLIIKHPDFSQNQERISTLIENADLFPTILDLLGIVPSSNSDGISFASLFTKSFIPVSLKDETINRKYTIGVNKTKQKFSLFDGQYKFILSTDKEACLYNGQREELYDLRTDPNEENNISMEDPERTDKFKTVLLEYINRFQNTKPESLLNENNTNDQFKKDMLKSVGY